MLTITKQTKNEVRVETSGKDQTTYLTIIGPVHWGEFPNACKHIVHYLMERTRRVKFYSTLTLERSSLIVKFVYGENKNLRIEYITRSDYAVGCDYTAGWLGAHLDNLFQMSVCYPPEHIQKDGTFLTNLVYELEKLEKLEKKKLEVQIRVEEAAKRSFNSMERSKELAIRDALNEPIRHNDVMDRCIAIGASVSQDIGVKESRCVAKLGDATMTWTTRKGEVVGALDVSGSLMGEFYNLRAAIKTFQANHD